MTPLSPGVPARGRGSGGIGFLDGGVSAGRAGVLSGRLRGCCTLERGTLETRWRVFRMIPRFTLECRFSAERLPCAEGTALHMGELQQR